MEEKRVRSQATALTSSKHLKTQGTSVIKTIILQLMRLLNSVGF